MEILLPLFAGIPLLTGGVTVLLRNYHRVQQVLLYLTLVLALIGAGYLIWATSGGEVIAHGTAAWPFGIAIPFVADMFSAIMLLTTTVLALACTWFSSATGFAQDRYFAPLVAILMSGVYGAVLTADIFNFFVFLEVMLLPSYGLYAIAVAKHAHGGRIDGMRLFISANLLASTVLLVGIGFVYGTAGTVNLAQLAGAAAEDDLVAVASAVVLVAMAMKASVFPVHTWLARTYPYTSPATTALFSGIHSKVGVYIIYRLYAVIFDGDSRWLLIGIVAFSLTMLIGVLGAVGENHSRSILVFHMVSQIGYILIGAAVFSELGITAGIFYLVHNMIAKTGLFLATGAVEVRYGSGELGVVTGMAKREPVIAVAFMVSALSLAGIPPFAGFVAKASLMWGTWEAGHYFVVILMAIVSIITLISMLKIWSNMFWGDEKEESKAPSTVEGTEIDVAVVTATDTDVDNEDGQVAVLEEKETGRIGPWLAAPAVLLAALSLGLGLGAEVLLDWANTAAQGLIDTSTYVEAVMNS